MSVQIKWGKMNFKVTGNVVRGVKGFAAGTKIKGDKSDSKKAFTENETIAFSITTSLATGGNPIKDYGYLKTFIGYPKKGYKMMVNFGTGSTLGKWKGGKFRLDAVDLSNTLMDSYGRLLAAEIKLSFTEVGTKKVGSKKTVKNKYRKQCKTKGW